MESTWREGKTDIYRSLDWHKKSMRSIWREHEIWSIRERNLYEDDIRSTIRDHEICTKSMGYTIRDHDVYMKRVWYLHEQIMRSTWRELSNNTKRSPEEDSIISTLKDLSEESLRSRWWEHDIYMKRSWVLN